MTAPPGSDRDAPRGLGIWRWVLAASASGYPLTRLAMQRLGFPGAVVVQTVCTGLLLRAAVLVAGGAIRQLRPAPAMLLRLELAAAAVSALSSLRPLVDDDARAAATASAPDRQEVVRRAAIATLFAVHTARVWIYVQPDHGQRPV